jgi:hypothetical protein
MNRWTQKDLERLYRHYQDKTGILDFQPTIIAAWAKKEGYDMPTPPTDVDLLGQLLSRAAAIARRKDRKTSILYRATLVCTKYVNGKLRKLWFDADGPAATADKVMESFRRRKDYALNVLVSAAATVEHWFQEHPDQRPEQLDLGIADAEVRWRLLGPRGNEDGEQKAG